MVQMEVAHYDRFDILDVMTSLFDRYIEFLIFRVIDPGKDVV